MIITNIRRILKTGFIDFWRNGFVSLTSILVFTVTLFILGSLILGDAVLDAALNKVRNQVDINVYMTQDAPESDILLLKDRVAALPEVSEVTYVSREEVLAQFKEKHKDNYTVLQSIEVLDENPLRAELNIRANDPSQYGGIANFLDGESVVSSPSSGVIEKINYYDNKAAIDKLISLTSTADKIGLTLSIIFIFIAVIVSFTTIRLAIFTSREEIGIMRLVGSSNAYIRGPFIVQGAMYGIFSAIIIILLFYPLSRWASLSTVNFFDVINLFDYYSQNIIRISLTLLLSGVLLGVVSSFLAVRKYMSI